jgi:hypothetical protein
LIADDLPFFWSGISGEVAMNQQLSLSTFTIEIDRQPVLVLQTKWQREAEEMCQEWLRTNLTALKSNGVPLCDAKSETHVRLARPDEKARWQASEPSRSPDDIKVVYLLEIDGRPSASLHEEFAAEVEQAIAPFLAAEP